MTLVPGTSLAQYEILGPLDAGGMGEIYRARDARLDRHVALKVLSPHLASDPDSRARFEREAKALAALSHPNILGIHELVMNNGMPVAVMELLQGENLRHLLARGAVPWRDAAAIAADVADGLGAAHAQGIIHRDLKPENLFLVGDRRVKILDFGLALRRPVAPSSAEVPTIARSESGLLVGTVGYMSPEQIQGLPLDGRSDLFALGCILYEMLAGQRPFTGATVEETLAAILRAPVPPLPRTAEPTPPTIERILAHCLDKRPERRFPSAGDLATALRALLNDSDARPRASRSRGSAKSLAVLPFFNTGLDSGGEYLSDGITESIINNLSQLPKLRVVPRSTVFRYRGREVDSRTVGLALNVRTLLTGRVTQIGDVLSIQAELVDSATDAQLWGQQFRAPLNDLFAVQEEIAWQISEALRLRLTGTEKRRLRKRPPANPAAYELYLKGLYHWNRWNAVDFRKAVSYFEQAVAADPQFALAHVGVAQSHAALSFYGYMPPREGYPRAQAATRRALALDDGLAIARVTLALGLLFFDWDWAQARTEFERGLRLDPRLPAAHGFHGVYLSTLGQFDAAVEEANTAQRLDPLSLIFNASAVWPLYSARRYDEALVRIRSVLDLDPGFPEALNQLVAVYERTGQLAKAADAVARLMSFVDPHADLGCLREGYRQGGDAGYWRAKLELLRHHAAHAYLSPCGLAVPYAALGELDTALDHLERAFEDRSGMLVFLKVDPAWDPLRGHPRFEELIRKVGIP